MKNIDWYNKLKLEIIYLAFFLKFLENETVYMICTNNWILSDSYLFEDFTHLNKMFLISSKSLDEFVERIKLLDSKFILFDKCDLINEFDFIKENICLESSFITNMINYMVIIDDYIVSENEKNEILEQYYDISISCYNQMKINNEQLKILRKERRDYFE